MKTIYSATLKLLFITLITNISYGQEVNPFPYSVDLTSLGGKVVNTLELTDDSEFYIVDFWNSGCKPCIVQLNSMTTEYDNLKDKKMRVIAVSTFPLDKGALKLIQKYQWPFEIYFDNNEKLYKKLRKRDRGVPLTIVYDKNWNEVLRKSGAKIRYINPEGEIISDPAIIMEQFELGNINNLISPLDDFFKLTDSAN